MDLRALQSRPVEWLKDGPESDVVVSSRIRLARNIEDYHFVPQAGAKERARVEELLHMALLSPRLQPPLEYVRLDTLEPLMRELLVERRLISADHAEADWVRGVAFDQSEQVSVLVNEEDHLRIQLMRSGLRLREVYEQADKFDDALADLIPYAFNEKYGYLTACPTNVGTGLRASVMLHLPGIVMAQEMDKVINSVQEQRLTLRGVYGEGTYGAGDFYQISNHVTLGPTERQIVGSVLEGAGRLVQLERQCRATLSKKHPQELMGRVRHALRLLKSATMISSQEALSLLSQVRMGAEMELLEETDLSSLNELLLLTLPAHLQTMEGGVLDTSVRNQLRASYVKERLTTG